MDLCAMGNARGTQRGFPATNDGMGDGYREEEVGLADIVVVEEILRIGAEGVEVENPAAEREGGPKLMFFVALALEQNKSQAVGIGKLQERTGGCNQGRGLVIVAVEGAESPIEMRDIEGNAKARTDCIFGNTARKVGGAHTCRQREPRKRL